MAKILATPPKVDKYPPPLREKAPEALHGHHTPINQEGPSTGPACSRASPQRVFERKPMTAAFHLNRGQASTVSTLSNRLSLSTDTNFNALGFGEWNIRKDLSRASPRHFGA